MSSQTDVKFDHLIKEFLAARAFALAGASKNAEKYGNIILKNMAAKGYKVIPVNPAEKEIEGAECYPDITSVPSFVRFVNVVLPPARSLSIIGPCVEKNIETIWFQPGSYDESVIAECEKKGLKCIYGPCIMVCATTGC